MNTAELLLMLVRWWSAIGAVVALAFLTVGVDRLDEDARGAYVFRPLIIPGVLLLWPLVLWRWYILASDRDVWAKRHKPRRHTHRLFAYAMPIIIVAIIVTGLSVRQQWPDHIAPEQLTAPEAS